jgi:hypothetical protein
MRIQIPGYGHLAFAMALALELLRKFFAGTGKCGETDPTSVHYGLSTIKNRCTMTAAFVVKTKAPEYKQRVEGEESCLEGLWKRFVAAQSSARILRHVVWCGRANPRKSNLTFHGIRGRAGSPCLERVPSAIELSAIFPQGLFLASRYSPDPGVGNGAGQEGRVTEIV